MTEFSLDTSGHVIVNQTRIRWSDLDPFTQGYVVGVCRAAEDTLGGFTITGIRFSDLAPETLATILKDCAAFQNYVGGLTRQTLGAREGARLWVQRNNGALSTGVWGAAFPPQTPYIDENGKVRFR